MRVLLTGGAGFIGSHTVEHLLKETDWELVLLDRFTYAGDMQRLAPAIARYPGRARIVYHDLRAPLDPVARHIGQVDAIIHMAAETHVDRSLIDPGAFVQSNVIGTFHMLEYARSLDGLERYVQVSTDEVYGPAPDGVNWKEWDRLHPSNPYSATKAGADCLAIAYSVSYGLPVLITRTMNNFGERQHPEKLVPKTISRLAGGLPMTVHGTPGNIGSRHWLHARNHADALRFLVERPTEPGDIVNIVGDLELSNLEMVERIAAVMGVRPSVVYEDFHSTRPGHDRRYALDGSKLRDMGWRPPVPFEESLARTVRWTLTHPEWTAEAA